MNEANLPSQSKPEPETYSVLRHPAL